MAERLFATTPAGILSGLRKIAPHVAIRIGWEEDPHFVWDGEGPDPRDEGYVPHNVNVKAEAVHEGLLKEGNAHLGGVYEKPGGRDPDIHGYFPLMVDEALVDLHIGVSGKIQKTSRKSWDPRIPLAPEESLLLELRNAIKFMNVSMKEIHERERRERRR